MLLCVCHAVSWTFKITVTAVMNAHNLTAHYLQGFGGSWVAFALRWLDVVSMSSMLH